VEGRKEFSEKEKMVMLIAKETRLGMKVTGKCNYNCKHDNGVNFVLFYSEVVY